LIVNEHIEAEAIRHHVTATVETSKHPRYEVPALSIRRWYRSQFHRGEHLKFITAAVLLASCPLCFAAAEKSSSPIQVETLVQSTSSWDGTPYEAYPAGQPQITVLKMTIAPHTTLKWHSHPMPNVGYILSGELTIEKKDGTNKHFVAGQAVAETVDSIHRGITGAEPLVVIVFYPGTPGLPVSNSDH
jgi:quercetin dioxygenase-like cupin family protein